MVQKYLFSRSNDQLLLDGTDSSSTNAGHQILTEDGLDFEQEDTHTTIIDGETNDRIVLEFDTFENLGVSSESGSIQRVHILKVVLDIHHYQLFQYQLPQVQVQNFLQ